jgi:hypothetical protein
MALGGRSTLFAAALAALLGAAPARAQTFHDGDVYARVTPGEVVLGNELAERAWSRDGLRTKRLVDKRAPGRTWSVGSRDFTLSLPAGEVGSEAFTVESVEVRRLSRGGLRVSMHLALAGGALGATRIAEAYPGVAGFRTQTILESAAPLALRGATLDEAVSEGAPTIHAFRAGADWRQPGYRGPDLSVGDAHGGTWRDSHSAGAGSDLGGPAQWLSLAADGRTLFLVMERNDFPSSRAEYLGGVARLRVDYARDVVILGPFEEMAHVENPSGGPGRERTLRPGDPFPLEAAFTGFGSHDGDEAWQFHRYLTDHRVRPYRKDVTFNSNGTDDDKISTGAKDDTDFKTVQRIAPIARRLGIETFILDDGWQARSGDWQPDSPEYPEPRSRFGPRFPDSEFRAVRQAIAPMHLGLWMSPMHFHPSSETYREHPEWICQPAGSALLAYNTAQPEDGSNEAGIVEWGPSAIPHVESRIRDAIENWDVDYFKFDFLAWLDCVGQGDVYDMHDAFLSMIDRLRRDFPRVTFQIDETNDYRLFPFESVARGPAWFQNGTPEPERLLHNLWNLSPFVPPFYVGQHFLGGRHWHEHPVDTLMAVALPSHLTFFSDLRDLPDSVIRAAAPWVSFYKRHRDLLAQLTYPLLRDPIAKDWTALQPWDPDAGRGALLAFRQDSKRDAEMIALRNVPPGRRFDLFRGPSSRYERTVTSAKLTAGLRISLARKRLARVLLILPARRPRLALRVRCAARGVRAAVGGRDRRRVRRVRFLRGRAASSDGRAPFARVLRSGGGRVRARIKMEDARRVSLSRRAPACATRRAAPRFTG